MMIEANQPDSKGPHHVQKMRFQNQANVIVRGLLAAPGLSRLVGQQLLTVYVVGRQSGRHYSVPVAYQRHADTLIIGTPFAWARNLHSGDSVDIRLLGRRRKAVVQVHTDEGDVVRFYGEIARKNRQFASFNNIRFDKAGEPDPGDLHQAWSGGGRVLQFTL
jgi:hypothetical protein